MSEAGQYPDCEICSLNKSEELQDLKAQIAVIADEIEEELTLNVFDREFGSFVIQLRRLIKPKETKESEGA